MKLKALRSVNSDMPRLRRGLLVGLAVFALAVLASSAMAAEVTRTEYREAAEPICKVDTQANERILAGVRSEVKQGKLKPASAKFKQAAMALKKAVKQLKALPQPSADSARLKKWFTYAEQEVKLFETGSRKLSSGDKNAASKIGVELVNVANKANAQVIPFEFKYCRLEPSRFI